MKHQAAQLERSSSDRQFRLVYILLCLVVLPFVLYYPSLNYDFIRTLDDGWLIIDNPAIKDFSWSGLRYIFFQDDLEMHYHPLTYFSLALDHHFFGLDPYYMRLHNLLLHIATSVLGFILLRKLDFDFYVALLAATLFAIHPLQMESVIWVICRRQPLFLFYAFAALIAYVNHVKQPKGKAIWFILALLFWVLSMMAKASSIVLPFLFVLLDWYLHGKKGVLRPEAMVRYAFTKPIILLFLSLNLQANQHNELVREFDYSWWEHSVFFLYSYGWYWIKAIWPWDLAPFYGVASENFPLPGTYYAYAIGGLALVISGFYALFKGKRFWIMIMAFYTITIVMKLNRIALPPADVPVLVADRYFYFSALAIVLAFACITFHYISSRWLRTTLVIASVVLCFSFSRLQMPIWKDTITLHEHIIKHYPNEEMLERTAISYYKIGEHERAYELLLESETLTTDIHMNNAWYFVFEKGHICFLNQDYERATSYIREASDKGGAEFPFLHFYLGISHLMEGEEVGNRMITKAYGMADQADRQQMLPLLKEFRPLIPNLVPDDSLYTIPLTNSPH